MSTAFETVRMRPRYWPYPAELTTCNSFVVERDVAQDGLGELACAVGFGGGAALMSLSVVDSVGNRNIAQTQGAAASRACAVSHSSRSSRSPFLALARRSSCCSPTMSMLYSDEPPQDAAWDKGL